MDEDEELLEEDVEVKLESEGDGNSCLKPFWEGEETGLGDREMLRETIRTSEKR